MNTHKNTNRRIVLATHPTDAPTAKSCRLVNRRSIAGDLITREN